MKKHKVCNCPSEYQNLTSDGVRCITCGGLNFGFVINAKNPKEKK